MRSRTGEQMMMIRRQRLNKSLINRLATQVRGLTSKHQPQQSSGVLEQSLPNLWSPPQTNFPAELADSGEKDARNPQDTNRTLSASLPHTGVSTSQDVEIQYKSGGVTPFRHFSTNLDSRQRREGAGKFPKENEVVVARALPGFNKIVHSSEGYARLGPSVGSNGADTFR